MLAHGERRLDGCLQVTEIVQRIEDPEHVDAVGRATLDEFFNQVVRVVPVAQDVLTAKQHLLRRVRHCRFEPPDPFPRILAQVADARIEGGAAPRLDGPKTHPIEFVRNWQHVVDTHPRRQQTLMSIAQYEFGNSERFFSLICMADL